MSRGAILFAFNSPKYDYYAMAEFTAKRINHFLDLPVTLVTDEESVPKKAKYKFDKIIKTIPDKKNKRDWGTWINKGRYQAYEFSPYDETLLLDVDYMVNTDQLNKIFDFYDDFCCHDNAAFLMQPAAKQEYLSSLSYKTLWATVVAFKKTPRAKQIFDSLGMVQNNFHYYADIHRYLSHCFRNDYGLTLALRIANGHITVPQDFIPWNLVHVTYNTKIYANTDKKFNTEFTILYDQWNKGKIKKEYLEIKDMDFHCMNKDLFVELIK